MKTTWKNLTLILAVAIVALAIFIITQMCGGSRSNDTVYDAIMTRSSVRSYTTQPVEAEKIEKMLRAGMAAPTGSNKQPWEFVVIDEREILDQIPSIIKGARMASSSQLAIAVLGKPALSGNWTLDCSAATENILLAAHSMGLGAVWCGAYPDNKEGRVGQLRELLGFSRELAPLSIIVIGYPDSEPTIKDKWDPAKVHYNRCD